MPKNVFKRFKLFKDGSSILEFITFQPWNKL